MNKEIDKELYYHNSKYNLYLSKSQILDAGLGVFTKDFIPKGTYIDEYCGDINLYNPGGSYVLELKPDYYIDGNNYPRCYMAMLNDCEYITKKIKIKKKKNRKKKIDITPDGYYDNNNNKLLTNCEFIKNKEDNKCYIYSLIDILPNTELFVSYGNNYWI